MPSSANTDSQFFWREVYRLVDEASVLPIPQRSAYLDEVCADLQIRVEAQRIVDLVGDPGEDGGHWAAAPAVPKIPERIGQHRLIRQIGSGGMAEIFLAERDDGQFQHRVALKLIRVELDTDSVRKRFLAERQILASLHHPNIAQLLDGGLSEDGRPYFVLELIEGAPLLEYCDQQRLSVDARLRLFLPICSAVQYAHGKLVVHRDLKPSNLLVTELGRPKLLDFGIAKLLSGTAAISMLRTPTGIKLMTPEYAAPEQFRGDPISTATDVHALGLLLYELLTGHRAYVCDTRTPWDVGRTVLETEPAPMSEVVDRYAKIECDDNQWVELTPDSVSAARSTTPANLRKLLRGDLQHIVDRALQKAPEARYSSAEALANDLQRVLDDQPISIRQGQFGYGSRKFVGRHRLMALGLAMFVVGGVLGLWLGQRGPDTIPQPPMPMVVDSIATPRPAQAESTLGLERLARGQQLIAAGQISTATNELELAVQQLANNDAVRPDYFLAQQLLIELALQQRRPEHAAILANSLLESIDSTEPWTDAPRDAAKAALARKP